MKKLLLILSAVILSYSTLAQIELRGKVLTVSKKQVADTGNITISTEYPLHTSMRLTDSRLLIDNMVNPVRYKLFDKEVSEVNKELVISYLSSVRDDLKLIAVSEINGCHNCIKVAIFDFTGSTRYIEYLVKLSQPTKRG